MREKIILEVLELGMPWQTADPFLFCVHHKDAYPHGNDQMGPDASLAGRQIGHDFSYKDGWSMYHGDKVPGFPAHPHRGFETITIARDGYIDHSDSLGATARFGRGDVQWMTAGKGVVHSEMFPLRRRDEDNPVELFQIWLNLPRASKLVDPHFKMFWSETIPTLRYDTDAGEVVVDVIAGSIGEATAPAPPPSSWASDPRADVAIYRIDLPEGATWELPAGPEGVNRTLYFFSGDELDVQGTPIRSGRGVRVEPTAPLELSASGAPAQLLVLQGRPLNEPVAQYGPFVMNTQAEIRQAMLDYQRTQFGGWPWQTSAPVHERAQGRFAVHADGRREEREG